MTSVAVVTVTYNSGEAIAEFVESLRAAAPADIPVVVADNGSADGSLAAIADLPNVQVLPTGGNLGYGGGANVGVAATDSEFVIVANPDIIWDEASVKELLAATTRWPKGGAFGPLIHTPEGEIYPSARALPSLGRGIGHATLGWVWPANPWTTAYRRERGEAVEGGAGWLSGSCLLLRREAFDAVGGFDDSYFMYFEDVDLGDRLGKAGWQNVYVPGARVTHIGGHSTSQHSAWMLKVHHSSAYQYLSRKYSGWQWAPVRVLVRLGLFARGLIAVRVGRLAAGAKPRRHLEP